jgi:two-component system alkaline phosphatase synthesis response regulator PhoP
LSNEGKNLNTKILIIEDEPGLLVTLTDRLKSESYIVQTAKDGNSGLRKAINESYDLIILDIMLPGKNGFDICSELRSKDIYTPILMLTARGQVTDKVVGLKLGADDYLVKPFEMIELLARIEALLRRIPQIMSKIEDTQYKFGNVSIDFRKAEVRKNSKLIELSAQEFRLLKFFIENKGDTLSRHELLDKVWGYESVPSTRTVDVHVAWLRYKLEENPKCPQYIVTVHKLGYKFGG